MLRAYRSTDYIICTYVILIFIRHGTPKGHLSLRQRFTENKEIHA